MRRLPERLEADDVLVRRWRVDDAEALRETIIDGALHLPSWMTGAPQRLDDVRALVSGWERDWCAGGDALLGIFVGGEAAGTSWLHLRGHDVIEIGYWIRGSFARRGLACTVATTLTDGAFSVPGIEWCEAHQPDLPSAEVLLELGYRLVEEKADKAAARGASIDYIWLIDREQWQGARRQTLIDAQEAD